MVVDEEVVQLLRSIAAQAVLLQALVLSGICGEDELDVAWLRLCKVEHTLRHVLK